MSTRSIRALKEKAKTPDELRAIEDMEASFKKAKESFAQKCGICGEKPVNHFFSLTDFDYDKIRQKYPELDILDIPQASLSICCECVDNYIHFPTITKDFMEHMAMRKKSIEHPMSEEEIYKYIEQLKKEDAKKNGKQ